jgi:hypothetical protein
MGLVELIVAVHDRLERDGLSHAFGGALALGYVATPRGTVDIDVNVFLPPSEIDLVVDALAPLGYRPPPDVNDPARVAGIRFEQATDPFPVDVFPSLDERYVEIERRRVHHPFGRRGDVLPFLSAEDLCVFKLSFGRPQDWVDLRAMASARPTLDVEYIERQVVGLRGPSLYPRVARLRGYLHRES